MSPAAELAPAPHWHRVFGLYRPRYWAHGDDGDSTTRNVVLAATANVGIVPTEIPRTSSELNVQIVRLVRPHCGVPHATTLLLPSQWNRQFGSLFHPDLPLG
jgi:hypothetical protein